MDCGHPIPGATCTTDAQLADAYDAALDRVRQDPANTTLFDADKTHVMPNDDPTRRKVFDLLVADLQAHGYCAGWNVDQIDFAAKGSNRFEGYHAINFGGGGLLRSAFAFRGYCTPGTPPTPPPPVASTCPLHLPLPSGYTLGLRLDKGGQLVDATPFVAGSLENMPPPGWTGNCRAKQCDLSPEKDTRNGLACTVELCGDHIDYSVDSGAILNWSGLSSPNPDDHYKAKFTLEPGRTKALITGTCPKSPGTQGSVVVP